MTLAVALLGFAPGHSSAHSHNSNPVLNPSYPLAPIVPAHPVVLTNSGLPGDPPEPLQPEVMTDLEPDPFRESPAGAEALSSDGESDASDLSVPSLALETYLVGPQGTTVTALGGQLELNFPPNAVSELVSLQIQRLDTASAPPGSPSGRPFRLIAAHLKTARPVTQFSRPITLTVHYDEAARHRARIRPYPGDLL